MKRHSPMRLSLSLLLLLITLTLYAIGHIPSSARDAASSLSDIREETATYAFHHPLPIHQVIKTETITTLAIKWSPHHGETIKVHEINPNVETREMRWKTEAPGYTTFYILDLMDDGFTLVSKTPFPG